MFKNFGAKLTCVITAVALVASIAAFFSLDKSLAWFASNREVSAHGMSVSVQASGISSKLTSLGVLGIENGTYEYEYLFDTNGELIELYSLPIDDPERINYSRYSKALVVMLTVNSTEDSNISIDFISKTDEVSLAAQNYFSNCITIASASKGSGNTVTKSGPDKAFVTVSDGAAIKNSAGMNFYNGSIAAGGSVTLYFVIEYNRPFLDYLKAQNLGYSRFDYLNDVEFVITETN